MNIKGVVTSGTGKGSYFVSREIYSDQFKEILGFKPYPGTLNIKISSHEIDDIANVPNQKISIIHGKEGFGDVKYIKAIMNNKINGALVFPVKTEHPAKILEFIAKENLRDDLHLKDGDLVILKLN